MAKKLLTAFVAVALVYAAMAYLVLPALWTHHEHQPGLANRPMVTRTKEGIPGDPLNIGIVGRRADVIRAFNAAGWFPADPVTLKSSLEIVGSVLLDRPYRDAPVSPLLYDGRVQDLAFEKPDGRSADRRHHVRFWRVIDHGAEGEPVWLGAATHDRSVGVSHYTGQVTHHIAPDIDTERDSLIASLTAAGVVRSLYQVSGIGPALAGRNGGGDPYWTDGEVKIARLTPDAQKTRMAPRVLAAPFAVQLKDNVVGQLGELLGR